MDKFKAGGSVYRVHAQYDEKRTIHEKKESVISWDATGGIVKNSSSKQCLYYELTITHPNIVDEGSLVPLTYLCYPNLKHFLLLNNGYEHSKNATERIVLLYVFNDKNYSAFLARAYRIVINATIRNDFSKTNIYACLSHFML
ncbi:unnamed protein product, partial [Rotaria socialis]